MEKKVPELALSRSQTDGYLQYHHRSFVWWQMELETHIGVLVSSQGPVGKHKKGEYQQGSQDHEELVHPLRQCV